MNNEKYRGEKTKSNQTRSQLRRNLAYITATVGISLSCICGALQIVSASRGRLVEIVTTPQNPPQYPCEQYAIIPQVRPLDIVIDSLQIPVEYRYKVRELNALGQTRTLQGYLSFYGMETAANSPFSSAVSPQGNQPAVVETSITALAWGMIPIGLTEDRATLEC